MVSKDKENIWSETSSSASSMTSTTPTAFTNTTSQPPPQTSALSRLAQVTSHLGSSLNTSNSTRGGPRKSRRHATSSALTLPADYSDVLSTITHLRRLASTPDPTQRGYARQKAAGKLWVRERVNALLDAGSLLEVGSISGTVKWKKGGNGQDVVDGFVPSNNVQGFGLLNGRKICFTADDYSIRAGHADGALWSKTSYLEKLALTLKLPVIKLVDGSSGGGSVTTIATQGFSYVPPLNDYDVITSQLNQGIPNLGAVLGPAIGLGAARVVACHFSVMAADVGSLFNAGPKVVAGATFEEDLSLTDLGGPDMHCRNGTIDNMALNEEDAFQQIRTVLSYLPNCGETALPPVVPCDDPCDRADEALRTMIPRRKERMYDVRKIIRTTVDKDSFFEIGNLWGRTVIVGFARFGGRPVGIVANNCEVNAGALDAGGSQKIAKHLKLCDVMNIPVVQFVDIPGYAIGLQAERAATMRHGVNLVLAYYTTTIPLFSVILRRVYGVAGGAMLDARTPRQRVAWPSGDWGSLPLQGGIEVGHSAELKKAAQEDGVEGVKKLYERLEKDYTQLMNPIRTANAFGIEEIIDPAVTRPVVAQWVEHIYTDLLPARIMERIAGKIRPQFG